jgi:hypothetical protein
MAAVDEITEFLKPHGFEKNGLLKLGHQWSKEGSVIYAIIKDNRAYFEFFDKNGVFLDIDVCYPNEIIPLIKRRLPKIL